MEPCVVHYLDEGISAGNIASALNTSCSSFARREEDPALQSSSLKNMEATFAKLFEWQTIAISRTRFLGNNDGILPVHPSSDTCMPRGDAVLVLVCYDRRNGLVRKWKGADVGVSCKLVISPSIIR